MRVIAGQFRSRKLKSVPGLKTRPTPDRLRESLFSIIGPRITGVTFIDAYAGTGAVGIEALSRGATQVLFLESDARALTILRENLDILEIRGQAQILRGNAVGLLSRHRADIAFLDPPYDHGTEYPAALLALSESGCPYVIAQHTSRLVLDESYAALSKTRVLRQGDNALSFYELS